MADEYIRRNDAKYALQEKVFHNLTDEFYGAMQAIDELPSADVVPVVHAHWCVTDAYPHNVYCSKCLIIFAQTHWPVWEDNSLPRTYCPTCGAKMDEEMSK